MIFSINYRTDKTLLCIRKEFTDFKGTRNNCVEGFGKNLWKNYQPLENTMWKRNEQTQ